MQTVPIKLFILLSIIWLLLVPFVPEHFPTAQIFMHSYPYICPWRWCQGNHNWRRCSQVSLFASKLSWELCAWKWQILSECTLLTRKKSQCIKLKIIWFPSEYPSLGNFLVMRNRAFFLFNPLHPNIRMHILHTVLCTFP